jgi:acyl-coenzyme A thioesterase PaaI-like protein
VNMGGHRWAAAGDRQALGQEFMDVTLLPFNRLVGLEKAPIGSGFLLCLPSSPNYLNHLGTVHATAQLALAEASSAEFLLQRFGGAAGVAPVVRRLEAKFRKPANGRIFSRATADESEVAKLTSDLEAKGRAQVSVSVEIVDENRVVAMTAVVEWFIAKGKENA